MTQPIGSVPYLRELAEQKLVKARKRAETIAALANQNFGDWSTMSAPEKDVTSRQALRALAELAEQQVRIIRYLLHDLKRDG